MDKHLIVLDLDGTLLTSEKVISPYTKKQLQLAMAAGHEVMIATGRPFRASVLYYNELRLSTPIVNFNGAYVHHPLIPEWEVRHTPLPLEKVHNLLDIAELHGVKNIVAEVKDDVYIEQYDADLMPIFNFGEPHMVHGNIRDSLTTGATSLLLQANGSDVESLRQAVTSEHVDALYYHEWGPPFHILELVNKEVNKAYGIQPITEVYKIPQERVIAFGDESNDLEMIEYAGVGVAMGNAIDDLKNIANVVTDTNDEDGIGKFLKDYLQL